MAEPPGFEKGNYTPDPVLLFGIDLATGKPVIFENSDGSIAQINHQHYQIHKGNGFTHAQIFTGLSSLATETHLIVTGANPVHMRSFNIQALAAPFTVNYHENVVTSANGALLGLGNNNRNSSKTALTTLFSGPTITDAGDSIGQSLVPSVSQKGGNGLDIITGGEWILKPNTKYTYAITNDTNQTIDYSVVMFLYEPDLTT